MPALLVITDLDGTLLDHHSYSHAAAEPALARLQALQVPVVFNSSKTLPEMQQIRKAMHNEWPFVVENGAALYLADGPDAPGAALAYGRPRAEIQQRLQEICQYHDFRFVPFSAMTQAQLVELTGLSAERAALAMQREWSEPLYWQDSDEALAAFEKQARGRGLHVVKGGRFVHVSGPTNKATCLPDLRKWFAGTHEAPPLVVALGDGSNDLPLLREADIAVQVRSPAFDFPAFEHPELVRTTQAGPAGWNEAMLALLERSQ